MADVGGYLQEYFKTAQQVVFDPAEFFSTQGTLEEYRPALYFAVTSSLVFSMLSNTVQEILQLAGLMQQAAGGIVTSYLTSLAAGVLAGVIAPFIGAAAYHIFVYLFKGNSYVRTYCVVAYATAVTAFFGWIPLANVVAALYSLYVTYRGIRELHEFSRGRSIAVLFLPLIVFIVLLGAVPAAV